jgi:polysaccharide biosynthesis/export protein
MQRVFLFGWATCFAPVVLCAQNPAPVMQQAPDTSGRSFSNAEIAQAIRNSGLTEAQIRARLLAAGFDPKLADPFFQGGAAGSLAASTDPRGTVDQSFANTLRALGIVDTVAINSARRLQEDTANLGRNGPFTTANGVGPSSPFGKVFFSGATTAFDAVTAGPVDASYRLGVGDQVQLVITGDMEAAFGLDVRRDGTILVPQIGQIPIAGLTLEAARATVRQRAGRVYNVIDQGRARVDLTVSRVRSNQVFVVGEVAKPGSYQVNALGTVFRALNAAGGPTDRGTFRNVEVRRAGAVVAHVDLYDYLLRGDASNDVRTEQGDIVFVGLSSKLVTLQGAVRRPGIYELRDSEKIARLLEFGGGTLPTAAMDRLLIDRVLPPAQRAPGKERALIDVALQKRAGVLDTLTLADGDVVTIFSVGDVRRNRVVLHGEVYEPGMYEWTPTLTLGQLMNKAQGFLPWALTDRIKIERQIPHTGRSEFFSVSVRDSSMEKVGLQEFDEVTVLDARRAFPTGTIAISGSIVSPGERPYAENMTLKDFIDLSGGFKPEAAVVELARRRFGSRYSDTAAVISTYPVEPGGRLSPAAASVILEREDRINVRDFPGYRKVPRSVTLVGLFTYPGIYVLQSDAEKVSDVVRRASGLLPSAYPAGARLIRDGRPVAIDLAKALRGDKDNDIYLSEGDRLEVGPDPSIVYVSGAVERQVIVPYHPGWQVKDYLAAAGGFSADADKDNIVVEYPSGEIRSRRGGFFMLPAPQTPPVISGSTITVGRKPDDKGGNAGEMLTRTVQVVSTLVSLVIGYLAVRR